MRRHPAHLWDDAVAPRLLILRYVPLMGPMIAAWLIAIDLALGICPVIFVLATSKVIGAVPEAVAAGLESGPGHALIGYFALAAAVFLLQQSLAPVQVSLGEVARRRVDERVHDRLIAVSLHSPGIGPLEDPRALDELAAATHQIESGQFTPGAAGVGMMALIARYVRLAGFLGIVGVVTNWLVALVLCLATMSFRVAQRGGMRKFSVMWSGFAGLRRRSEYLREVAIGSAAAKEIRVFGLDGWLADTYADTQRGWLATLWRERRRIYLGPYLVHTAIGLGAGALVLVVLAREAARGAISLRDLAMGMQATIAALMLGEAYPESDTQTAFGMRAVVAMERFEALVRSDLGRTPTGTVVPQRAVPQRSVRFEGVSFRYPGNGRDVLADLDLELPAGSCTAVVGLNGAGKTTLIKLLTRLHEPTSGRITADGTDIREFDVDSWRRRISVIFQDFIRYEMPVTDNIRLGAVEATASAASIRAAVEKAGALPIVEALPQGLDTPLSRALTGGADLSGGQWQRMAIARSLYALSAGARVLVLDEPTSALDVRAEAAFFEEFVSLTRGVTSLLISHRFSSVRRADHIVVLSEGRVAERGTHAELMARDGLYAGLFRLQADRFAQEDGPAGQEPGGEDAGTATGRERAVLS